MPKNFFRKIKESMIPHDKNGSDRDDKSHDFERAKDVLFSAKNLDQLTSAVKYINNFNKKHKIRKTSPEFIYFDKMINVIKTKLRFNRFDVDTDLDESDQKMCKLRNIIKESLDDLDWIEQSEPTFKANFDFDEKEYWVDLSKLDSGGIQKIIDYIKKTIPEYRTFNNIPLDDSFKHMRYSGIIIHCGSENTDYEPEEDLICYSDFKYENDYIEDHLTTVPHVYVDGREVLEYINLIADEEELEESLEWTDKDVPFDEKDKSFETDPAWTDDEDWKTNPERSYWKQGDSGGSGGDMNESEDLNWIKDVEPDELTASPNVFFRSDDEMYYTLDQLGHDITNMEEITMCELAQNYGYRWSDKHEGWYHRDEVEHFPSLNESQDLNWIKDVSSEVPSIQDRTKIDLKDFLMDFMEDESTEMIEELYETDQYIPTDEYHDQYSPAEYKDVGKFNWLDGDWKEHGEWDGDPWVGGEVMVQLEEGCDAWEFIDHVTDKYDLETSQYEDLYIFKRNKDGRYFTLSMEGSYYDGNEHHPQYLYEVFQQKKIVYESESGWEWLGDTKEHANYKGHPQGIVQIYDHDEIDRLCDVIDNYNGFPSNNQRADLHQGLEYRRDELEQMSTEDGEDYDGAMLSVSFFVEKPRAESLHLGYWPYEVDEWHINDWLSQHTTYNKQYELYERIEEVEQAFKHYQKPR